jgi:hypothetical protein
MCSSLECCVHIWGIGDLLGWAYIYIDLLGLLVVGLSDCQCKSITYNDGFPNSHLCVLALQTPSLVPDFNRRRWRARSATDRQVRRSNKNQMSTAWLVSRDCYTLFIGGSCICRVLHGFCDFILYIYSIFYDRFTLYYTFYKEFHQTYRHLRPIFQSIFLWNLVTQMLTYMHMHWHLCGYEHVHTPYPATPMSTSKRIASPQISTLKKVTIVILLNVDGHMTYHGNK